VIARRAEYKKTWQLQAMKPPTRLRVGDAEQWTITNGQGRLFVQTLLPAGAQVHIAQGDELYLYDSDTFAPERATGPAPEARMQVSPRAPSQADTFLHVLTATDAATEQAPAAQLDKTQDGELRVRIGDTRIHFPKAGPAVIAK
jgi:hypothetical protein